MTLTRPTCDTMSLVVQRALAHGILKEDETCVLFYDLDCLRRRLHALQDAFPPTTLHAVAIKANPVLAVLAAIAAEGCGGEAASMTEVELALHAGVPADRVVYNSPVKTRSELRRAVLELGVNVNADNLDELERISTLAPDPRRATVALRVNPQIGEGAIRAMSVAGVYSKFGVPLRHARMRIHDAFRRHPWLSGLHVHSGSQTLSVDRLVDGVAAVVELAEEINAHPDTRNRITTLNIGGGLPVAYRPDEVEPTPVEYVAALRAASATLLGTPCRLVTEFGRWVHSPCGWVASRVEYTKSQPEGDTLLIHAGADLLLRECYNPGDWHHEVSLLDGDGQLPTGEASTSYTVAGPLCFGGDILRRDARLPGVGPGDILLIHDCGANSIALWSRHCSRLAPRVVGYTGLGADFIELKRRETVDDLLRFWS